jgi:GH24 family phage-related lysozyme (muramidase)
MTVTPGMTVTAGTAGAAEAVDAVAEAAAAVEAVDRCVWLGTPEPDSRGTVNSFFVGAGFEDVTEG